jgi:inorganic pyrophosphatase
MKYHSGPDPQGKYPVGEDYWDFLERLVETSRLVIDRPRGSAHPRYPDFVYPLDYGYLERTQAIDGGGIDVWLGSLKPRRLTGIVFSVDLLKRDVEVKILLGCSDSDVKTILSDMNQSSMRAIYIPRPNP